MKVITPTEGSTDITLTPRYYPSTALTVSLYNEATKVTTTPANSYSILDGYLTVTFTQTFVDKDKHQIKIVDASNTVVYRGKSICTSQEPQDFKLTDGKYLYE